MSSRCAIGINGLREATGKDERASAGLRPSRLVAGNARRGPYFFFISSFFFFLIFFFFLSCPVCTAEEALRPEFTRARADGKAHPRRL